MGFGGETTGPGDVAMAGGVQGIGTFAEHPAPALVGFAQGEVIGGDVLLAAGETFLDRGELVHEGEAEVMFFGREIDGSESATEILGGIPADLAAEAGLVAGGFEAFDFAQEAGQDGVEEIPVFGAAGEEGAEPEFGALALVDVDDGEVALAGGGDIEAKAIGGAGLEDGGEFPADELFDFVLAVVLPVGAEGAELLEDLVLFEMEADNFVIVPALFDGGIFDDAVGSGAHGIAEVGLFIDFLGAGAGFAVGEEFLGREAGVLGAVDDIEEAEFDGVGHGDAVVQIPRGAGRNGG